ncbi:hypothetical protein ES703_73013 [subsurface metagenome]
MAERSANTNLILAGGLRFIMFFAYFFGGFLIIRIFSTDLLVIEYGVDYLRAVAVGWILGVFAGVYGAAFRGAGNNTPPQKLSHQGGGSHPDAAQKSIRETETAQTDSESGKGLGSEDADHAKQ